MICVERTGRMHGWVGRASARERASKIAFSPICVLRGCSRVFLPSFTKPFFHWRLPVDFNKNIQGSLINLSYLLTGHLSCIRQGTGPRTSDARIKTRN